MRILAGLHSKTTPYRFVKYTILTLIVFLLYHALIWHFYTSKLLNESPSMRIGDLARVGYELSVLQPRETIDTLPKRHIEFSQWKGEPIDLITIGDSFSNGGAGGENRYYQDFLCTRYNISVMNINTSLYGENYLDAILGLYKSGILDIIHPKAVLVESLENYLYKRFLHPPRWDSNISKRILLDDLKTSKWGDGKPIKEKQYFITMANYKLPLYNFYYLFSPDALGYSDTYKVPLRKPLFSTHNNKTLLFHMHDLTSIPSMTLENISLINQNINLLATILADKDIRLMTMFVTSKYDLYNDYIEENSFQKNPFFDIISPMEKKYTYINTKKILSKELQQNHKDIYFADDMHWSNFASKAISEDEAFSIFQSEKP